jgi:pentalenene oxygenase
MTDTASGTFTAGTAPGAWPLIGHAWPLARRPWEFFSTLSQHGDLMELRVGPQRVFVPCHPELLRQVLADDRTFDKGGIVYDGARQILGNGLVACPHASHRRQRRLLQPAFTRGQLAHYGPAVEREVTALSDSWRTGQVIDVYPVLYRLALRSLIRSLFSVPAQDRTVEVIQHSLEVLMSGVARRMFTPGWMHRLPTPGNKRYNEAERALHAEIDRLIGEFRRSNADGASLLSLMSATRDEDGGAGLSDAEIHDEVIGMLHAGSETTAMVLTWTLHRLVRHPDVQRRLQEEADGVLAGRPASYDDIPGLRYAGRVFTEALRIYPPAWAFTRTVTSATELAGRTLPPGTTIVCCSLATHNYPGLFSEPAEFDPDRWLPGRPETPSRSALTTFGLSARRCIGDSYAMNEAVLALATFAGRWQFAMAPGSDTRLTPMTIGIYPRRLLLQLTARQPAAHPGAD